LIKEKLKLKSGSKVAQKEKVGHLTFEQLKEIAEQKMVDMNAIDLA
jgi:large subunit ribosomal protein L11